MPPKNEYRLKQPRSVDTILVTATCYAAPVLFIRWDDMPKGAKDEFDRNGPIPCEGGGTPGEWCEQCRFGQVEFDRDYSA